MRSTAVSLLALAAAAFLSGCGGPKSQVVQEDAVVFRSYRHIGIQTFADAKGKGQEIADAIDARFQEANFEPVDQKALAQILSQYKPDRELGYGIETLEIIRNKTGADVLLMGRMTPTWSAATVSMAELSTGAPIMRAVLRPRGRKHKVFTSPADVADEFFRVYRKLR